MNSEIILDKSTIDKNFDLMLILLAEGYIDRCKMPKVSEVVKEVGGEYKVGQVYGAHIQAVQRMLIDEFKIMGLDLIAEVEKHNEKFEIGKFSKYENDIVLNKIENLVFITNKIKEYKEKNGTL